MMMIPCFAMIDLFAELQTNFDVCMYCTCRYVYCNVNKQLNFASQNSFGTFFMAQPRRPICLDRGITSSFYEPLLLTDVHPRQIRICALLRRGHYQSGLRCM